MSKRLDKFIIKETYEIERECMKKSERNDIIKWANGLSDKELENEYYDLVYRWPCSQTDKMYELGYDMVDILERQEYEKFLCQKLNLLEELCGKRGIELWKGVTTS